MSTELDILTEDTLETRLVTELNVFEIVTPGPQGIQGPVGTLDSVVLAEVPMGDVNSSNTDFTTAAAFLKLWVYLNGLRMNPGSDYNVTGADSFTFTYAPSTGDTLIVDYVETT